MAALGDGADGAAGGTVLPNGPMLLATLPVAATSAAVDGVDVGTVLPSSVAAAARTEGGGGGGPRCQVERCGADLREAGKYNRRHKVCTKHSRAPAVLVAGLRQRFCQQCSRFHVLSEFDNYTRSCRWLAAGRRRQSRTAR